MGSSKGKNVAKPDRKFTPTEKSDALVRMILRETARGAETTAVKDALVRRIERQDQAKKSAR
jgi:hypothetical protein